MQIKEFSANAIKRMNSMYIPDSIGEAQINVVWVRLIDSADEIFLGTHHHTFCEVHICLEGEFTYEFDGESITAKEGEGVFVPPYTEHIYGGGDFRKCALAFSANPDSEFYKELLNLGARKFNYSIDILQGIEGIAKALTDQDCFSAPLCAGQAFKMVHSVLKYVDFPFLKESVDAEEVDPRLTAAKKYIRANIKKRLTCEEVASECGLSSKQLGRIFNKFMGQNLTDYIKECKLKVCEEMLTDSRYTVKEVGYELGFDNEYYFNSFFKRHYGMPPGIFRKQNAFSREKVEEGEK